MITYKMPAGKHRKAKVYFYDGNLILVSQLRDFENPAMIEHKRELVKSNQRSVAWLICRDELIERGIIKER